MKCSDCKYYNSPDDESEFCGAALWDREEDSFLHEGKDFEEYINKKRLCTEFEMSVEVVKANGCSKHGKLAEDGLCDVCEGRGVWEGVE